MNEFDAFARFYDSDIGTFSNDLPFYRELARRTGGPILELMCGTGRVLLPLARDGYRLTGIDVSPQLLNLARRKLESGRLLGQVDLVQADVRELALEGPFALAFAAINSFMHLTETDDQLQVLRQVHTALAPGGLLALDMFNPTPQELMRQPGELVHEGSFVLPDGAQVQKFVVQSVDPAAQQARVLFLYDELAADGLVRRTVLPFTMRWLHRFEIEHLLARAGFELEMIYGSYDLDEYSSESPQMLTLARKA